MKLNVTEILNYRKQGACSTLLEFQNFKFLFDCGLSSKCSVDDYSKFKEKLSNIDIIFLSRSDRSYSGALTFLISKYEFKGKIFTTLPVKYLSSLNHQIYYLNRISKTSFDKTKISEYFTKSFELHDKLIELKFKQKLYKVRGFDVKVEAFCCGNSIGASFWNVSVDGMSFGYLVQYNHQNEFQYLGIMRSLSEFMNSRLSTYIFGDDKKFLFFKFFRVLEYEAYLKEDKGDSLDIVIDLTTEVGLGRKYKLLEEVNSNPKNQLIFVDEIPSNFDTSSNSFIRRDTKQDTEEEVERILEEPEILVPSGDEGEDYDGKNEDKTSTKAPSVIQAGMEEENIDEEKETKEVNFGLENGFFSFAKFQEIKEETFYGRPVDDDIEESLKKLNMISNAHPGKDLDKNLLHNNSNFDFFESLHNVEEIPDEVRVVPKAECLNLQGVSDGYSMKIILKNLNANTIVLVNGNEEENEAMLALGLNKKKIRALTEEKRIYKGSLHRSRLNAVFTKDEPEDIDFKTLRGEELYFAKVNAKVEVQYDKKTKKIIHKNSLITILDDTEKTMNEVIKTKKDEEELVYSSLDKFRLIDFKNFLKEEGIETKVECGRLNVKDKVFVVQSKGKLSIDGIFSEEYFKVRKLLYRMMMIKA